MKKLGYAFIALNMIHLLTSGGSATAQTVQIYRGASAIGTPHSSVAAAIAAATDGDSLRLSAHTFNERDLNINKSLVFAGTYTTTDSSKVDAQGLGRCFIIKKRGISITMRDFIVTGGYSSGNGGGIYFDEIPFGTSYTSLTLAGKMIVRANTSDATGGGIGLFLLNSYLKLTIRNQAQVCYNIANKAGGVSLADLCILALEGDAYIHHNTAVTHGGVVANDMLINGGATEGGVRIMYNKATNSAGGFGTSKLTVNSTLTVSYNSADSMGGGVGGLMYLYGAGSLLVNNNTAYYGGGVGGATRMLGGGDSATVIVSNNRAKFGGGAGTLNYGLLIRNMQIINNIADSAGGGIFMKTTHASKLDGRFTNINLAGNSAPKFPGLYAEKNLDVRLKSCRLFNPMPSGKQSVEVYAANGATVSADSCWFGKSDTAGLLRSDATSYIELGKWVQCKWVLNKGLPVSWLPFPLTAKFKLNSGAAIKAGSFQMLEGRFSGTFGFFTPALASISAAHEVESIFKATAAGTSNIMGIVDADTFKTTQLVTSIKEVGFEQVKIYPNPAKDILNIAGVELGSELFLYNAQGRLMKNEKVIINNGTLDISTFPAGNYLLKIVTKERAEGSATILLHD